MLGGIVVICIGVITYSVCAIWLVLQAIKKDKD